MEDPISDAMMAKDIKTCSKLLDDISEGVDGSAKQLELVKQKLKGMQQLGEVDSVQANSFQYIDVKSMLLFNYCMNLQYYALLKVKGTQMEQHEIFERLSYLRLIIEKLKPLDKKIEYQIEKLLKSVVSRGPEVNQKQVSIYKH
jgi:hypothetical protein